MVIKEDEPFVYHQSGRLTMEQQPQQHHNHHQMLVPPAAVPVGIPISPQQHHRRDSVSLSDYYSDNEPNDMDFNEVAKMAQYREAIEIIQRKCESLSKDNEKLVRRLHCVKRLTKIKEKDVSLLKARLDVYNDEWRTAQPESQINGNFPSLISSMGKQRKQKIRKNDKNTGAAAAGGKTPKGNGKLTGKRKRIKGDKEKDPNAPKRPANPFFQFCQEQRSLVMEQLNSESAPGQPELSKQELTKQLANRWRIMSNETKQIYIDKYESSKQKYHQEMEFYKREGDKSGQ